MSVNTLVLLLTTFTNFNSDPLGVKTLIFLVKLKTVKITDRGENFISSYPQLSNSKHSPVFLQSMSSFISPSATQIDTTKLQ